MALLKLKAGDCQISPVTLPTNGTAPVVVNLDSRKPPTVVVAETIRLEEAFKLPATCKLPTIEEEALEIKPPVSVDKFLTNKVLEAFKAPATCNPAPIEDEALLMKPVWKLVRPDRVSPVSNR